VPEIMGNADRMPTRLGPAVAASGGFDSTHHGAGSAAIEAFFQAFLAGVGAHCEREHCRGILWGASFMCAPAEAGEGASASSQITRDVHVQRVE